MPYVQLCSIAESKLYESAFVGVLMYVYLHGSPSCYNDTGCFCFKP